MHLYILTLFKKIFKTLDIGDSIMFLYILAVSRQYMWSVNNNVIAWICSVILTISIWAIYKKYKDRIIKPHKITLPFFICVGIPVLILFGLRLAFPDTSFDIINARLLIAQKSLTGPVLARNDVDYTFIMNSVSDMAMGIIRTILGYRLGTFINLLVLFWLGLELDRLMTRYIQGKILRVISIIAILLVENIYYETNTYMIDLLALPILIHLLYLSVDKSEDKAKLPYMAFLSGMTICLKLTNIVFIIPIIFFEVYNDFKSSRPKNLTQAISKWGLSLLIFSFTLIPFHYFIFLKTGNPVAPLYNTIFHSPYYAFTNFKDGRWGPKGLIEVILWPIIANFYPERISELSHYSGRIGLGLMALIISLISRKKTVDLKFLSFFFLLSSLLWSLNTGYIRYGIFLDILAGIIITIVLQTLFSLIRQKSLYRVLALILIFAVQLQLIYALFCSFNWEWSWRPTFMSNPKSYISNIKYICKDYSLSSYLETTDQKYLNDVGAWLETSLLTSGLEIQLKDDVPVALLRGYFDNKTPREKINNFIDKYSKNMYTLCKPEDLPQVTSLLQNFHLSIENEKNLEIPYYSPDTVIKMLLLKIGPTIGQLQTYGTPLPEHAYNALIEPLDTIPNKANAGEQIKLRFKVSNLSSVSWSMAGKYPVRLGNHWSDMNGKVIINDDGRTDLVTDLEPGKNMDIDLNVKAPFVPGDYILEIDMVQEGVAWFGDKGSKLLTFPIRVE